MRGRRVRAQIVGGVESHVGLALVFATIVMTTACDRGEPTLVRNAAIGCEAPDGPGTWIPPEGQALRVTDVFGLQADEWIEEAGGMALVDSLLWVFDAGRGNVLRLTSALSLVDRVGRPGKGPGELSTLRHIPEDWIAPAQGDAVDGARAVVFDGSLLHWFSGDGEFVRRTDSPAQSLFPHVVSRIVQHRLGVLYGRDLNERTGERMLELWLFDDTGHRKLMEFPLPSLPLVGGVRTSVFVDQASPSWTATDNCVYVTDGSRWLYVERLDTGQRDSLLLPDYDPPEPRPADDQRWRAIASMPRGPRAGDLDGAEATAPARWSDLVVDPDGWVWLRGWKPHSYRAEPDTVFVLRPDGSLHSFSSPTFPRAFGSDGALFGFAIEDSTDETQVIRVR